MVVLAKSNCPRAEAAHIARLVELKPKMVCQLNTPRLRRGYERVEIAEFDSQREGSRGSSSLLAKSLIGAG